MRDSPPGLRATQEADLPLEVAILLLSALTLLLTGALLFPVSTGNLPYYEEGLFGLLLAIFAVQTITMGKTPFGDAPRSTGLVVLGVAIAAVGIVTGFIPGLLGAVPRVLLAVCFGVGGLVMLVRVSVDKQKMRSWWQLGGILRHLVVAVVAVYGFSILIGALLWWQQMLTTQAIAVVALTDGVAIAYLAVVLHKVYLRYPQAAGPVGANHGLTTDNALLLLTATFMLLLGVLLVPVGLGKLPFSGSAQLGLLMVIFAIQMLASGNTPIGAFRRSWLMIGAGLLVAALGIISSIVPGVLVAPLTILVGMLNIAGGLATGYRVVAPLLAKTAQPRTALSGVEIRLGVTQLTMALLGIIFGVSMLIAGLIPTPVLGVVLTLNGLVLVYLLYQLVAIQRLPATVG